ncbi:MAG: clostripain-related cysteine peptidase [Candidatus Ozemobacteraceae bacterium]
MKRVMSILALVMVVGLFASPVGAAEKDWTWMVFLNADNNLDSFGVTDQEEMAKVGSNDWLNIVSLIDRENGPASLNYIEKGNIKKIKDMGELDMGDYKQMVSFVKDTVAAYPAKHYALIIWNHGAGWKNTVKSSIQKGISYDDSTGNHMTTGQLNIAGQEIKKILGKNLDILCMDACLMQMAEVVYAVKNDTDFVVASEETEPGAGYPYDKMLGGLANGMEPAEFVKGLVAAYAASYNNGSQGSSASTQSAVDCSKFDALKDAIDGFAKASIAGAFGAQFKTALTSVQKFYYRTNIDLPHLVTLLKASIKDEAFQTAATKLDAALKALIVANGNTQATMKNAFGLAIYFPTSAPSFDKAYNELAFAKDTMWDEMVMDFYKKTTAPTIIADLEKGDIASLIEYVSASSDNNREVSEDLISKLNFRAYAEAGMDAATQTTLSNLVKELKNK